MSIHAVVFDLGGVLENEIASDLYTKWEARLQLVPGEVRRWFYDTGWLIDATYGKFSEDEMLRKLQELSGMNQREVDEFMDDFWKKYCGELNTELVAYFQRLRSRYKTALLTNGIPGARRIEQERFHFNEMADCIIYSYEEQTAKPERRIYEILCERLAVQPAEIILLDDIEQTIQAANEFGIHAILFKNNAQAIAMINELLLIHQ